jgi:hypothetical protein
MPAFFYVVLFVAVLVVGTWFSTPFAGFALGFKA